MPALKGTKKVLFYFNEKKGASKDGTFMGYKNQNLNQRPNNLVRSHVCFDSVAA